MHGALTKSSRKPEHVLLLTRFAANRKECLERMQSQLTRRGTSIEFNSRFCTKQTGMAANRCLISYSRWSNYFQGTEATNQRLVRTSTRLDNRFLSRYCRSLYVLTK